jgi:hypothetical protein
MPMMPIMRCTTAESAAEKNSRLRYHHVQHQHRLTTDKLNSGPEPLRLPRGASMPEPAVLHVVTVEIVVTAETALLVAALSALLLVPAVVTTHLARKTAVSATTTAETAPAAQTTVSVREIAT